MARTTQNVSKWLYNRKLEPVMDARVLHYTHSRWIHQANQFHRVETNCVFGNRKIFETFWTDFLTRFSRYLPSSSWTWSLLCLIQCPTAPNLELLMQMMANNKLNHLTFLAMLMCSNTMFIIIIGCISMTVSADTTVGPSPPPQRTSSHHHIIKQQWDELEAPKCLDLKKTVNRH